MDHPNNPVSHSLMLLIRKNIDNENIQGMRDAQGMNLTCMLMMNSPHFTTPENITNRCCK